VYDSNGSEIIEGDAIDMVEEEEMEEISSPGGYKKRQSENRDPIVPVFDAHTMASLAQVTDSYDENSG
jgi:hypothetical protein